MRRVPLTAPVALAGIVLSACAASGGLVSADGPGAETPPTVAVSETTEPPVELVGEMALAPVSGVAGTEVLVRGTGLPPSSPFTLTWSGHTGAWDVRGDMNEEFHGRVFTPTTEELALVTTDEAGAFEATFVVPEGFGFAHNVSLVDADGVVRNRALFTVEMSVSVSPTSGPVGTPITIEIDGLGIDNLENNRQILYDNRYVGWISAVTTNGSATATITATGAVGDHELVIGRGAFTFPYLNPQQSPRPDIPVFRQTFTVTPGDPVLPPPASVQGFGAREREPASSPAEGAWITTDLASGPVGTPLTVTGGGFDPGTSISLAWYRIVGNRVSGAGWDEQSLDLGTVTIDGDGGFTIGFDVPTDVGGPHRIEALVAGEAAAESSFDVSVASADLPGRMTAGEPMTIELTGVGWTETANIYTVVYDNAYIGYACGFNSQGDVIIELTATGGPGWHFIDLYPAIYKGEEKGVQSFRIPQLTYVDDHPGESLPAFRYAFFVEG